MDVLRSTITLWPTKNHACRNERCFSCALQIIRSDCKLDTCCREEKPLRIKAAKEVILYVHISRKGVIPMKNLFSIEKRGSIQKTAEVSLPEMALIAGTRALLGAGVGFLLSDRFNLNQRRAIGWTLVMVGAITTIPLALEVFGKER